MERRTGVRALKLLPDRVELHLDGGRVEALPCGGARVTLLHRRLGRWRRGRTLAVFLYFPDPPGATVLVEERQGRYVLLVREERAGALV